MLKRGQHRNELTQFRYDVILHAGQEEPAGLVVERLDWESQRLTLPRLTQRLERDRPAHLMVCGLPNARVLDARYRWSGIVSVSAAPSAIPGFDPPAQASVAVLRVFGRAALGVSFDVGLTDGSADFAVGSTWRFVF